MITASKWQRFLTGTAIRGTVAMAKLDGNPDSATNQWFINLGNNAANLDQLGDNVFVFH